MLKYESINVSQETMARVVSFKNDHSVRIFSRHWHKSTELLYCRKGSLIVGIHAQEYTITEGEILYINSNIPHETKSIEPNEVHMIQFKHPFYDINREAIILNTMVEKISLDTFKTLTDLMMEATRINWDRPDYYELKLNALLSEIKYILACNFLREKEVQETDSMMNQVLQDVILYIDENYQFGITVNDAANYTGYSLSYFSRKFKEYTGISCVQYLQNRRLEKALELMSQTKMSISEISISSGFPNVKALRKSLYEGIGMTPTEYRYQYQNDS